MLIGVRKLRRTETVAMQDIYDPLFVKGAFDRTSAAYRYWSQIATFVGCLCTGPDPSPPTLELPHDVCARGLTPLPHRRRSCGLHKEPAVRENVPSRRLPARVVNSHAVADGAMAAPLTRLRDLADTLLSN
jgi:hypothetical protein